MRHLKIVLLMLIVLTIMVMVFSTAMGQSMSLSPTGVQQYNKFLVADLGLIGTTGRANTIFSASFSGTDPGNRNFFVAITVEDDVTGDVLLEGETETKNFNSEMSGKTFTNFNISDAENLGGDFEINEDAANLGDQVLATAALPQGSFTIRLALTPEGGSPIDTETLTLRISPPYIQPVYPVDISVTKASLEFKWITNIADMELRLFEDPAGTREVISGFILPALVGGAFRFGPGGIQILDGAQIATQLNQYAPGTLFYWQIDGVIKTSHGNEPVRGTRTQFAYYEELDTVLYIGLSEADKRDIKNALIELLEKIVNRRAAKSIRDYDVNRVVLDNSVVSREEIITILQKIIDGELEATSISFR